MANSIAKVNSIYCSDKVFLKESNIAREKLLLNGACVIVKHQTR